MDPMMMAQAGSALAGLIASLTQGQGGDNMLKHQRDAIRRQEAYTEASVNPLHPWAKALSGAIRNEMQRDAANSALKGMIARQRSRARGYGGALGNPARRDESTSSALADAFMKSGLIAQQEASKRLGQAGGQQTSFQWNPLNQQQQAQNTANFNNRYGMMTGAPVQIAGLYELLSGMFGGSNSMPGAYGSDGRMSGMSPSGTMLTSLSGMQGGGV